MSQKNNNIRVPKGMWTKCKACEGIVYIPELEDNQFICPKCKKYFRMDARKRINSVLDDESFEEFEDKVTIKEEILDFPGYREKLADLRKKQIYLMPL